MNDRNFTVKLSKYINIMLRVYSGEVTYINDGVPAVVNINQWNIIIVVVIYHYQRVRVRLKDRKRKSTNHPSAFRTHVESELRGERSYINYPPANDVDVS